MHSLTSSMSNLNLQENTEVMLAVTGSPQGPPAAPPPPPHGYEGPFHGQTMAEAYAIVQHSTITPLVDDGGPTAGGAYVDSSMTPLVDDGYVPDGELGGEGSSSLASQLKLTWIMRT